MAYPSRLLNDRETVTVDLHPHWWFLVPPISAVVVSIGAGVATLTTTDNDTTVRTAASWIAMGAILLSVGWLAVRYSRWLTTHFVVTDLRLIYRSGLLVKHGIEIPIDRVQAVHFHQGILERMVGAGDLLIESGGESGQQQFTDIRQPDRVQREIHAQMANRGERTVGQAPLDVADRLERLEQLWHRGTITDEEFERQKRRLLDD